MKRRMSRGDRLFVGTLIGLGFANLGLAALLRSASAFGYVVIAVAWFTLAFFSWMLYRR